MSWTQLTPKEAADFLHAVTGNGDPVFFEPSLCEVHTLELSFYDGYSLMRIVNKHSIPYLLFDYLSNGEQHYYLDGSERPFHNVNAQGSINLNEQNVTDYIDLFISYVYERGNSLIFVHEGEIGAPVRDAATDTYSISLPLIYQDRQVDSRIEISKDGKIFVREPLEVSFLTELHPDSANPYRHPHEEKIIEQSKALLSVSKTGKALMTEMKDPDIRVLSSPNYQYFVTNGGVGYMTMPAAEQNAKYTQALLFAACLRGIKQAKDGYLQAHPINDKELYTSVNYGKNLDILTETCKIIDEYEAQFIPEALDALKKMHLESVYEAFKNGQREGALRVVYFDTLEQADLMEDES